MAFEITCGQCGGRLLVETAGVIVACPLCDAHLSVPHADEESPAAPVAEPTTAETEQVAEAAPVSDAPTLMMEPQPSPPLEFAAPPAAEADPAGVVLGGEPTSNPTEWISHSSPNLQEFVVPDETADDQMTRDLFQPAEDAPDFSAVSPADPNAATIQLPAEAVTDAPTVVADAAPAAAVMAAEAATQVLPPTGEVVADVDAVTEQFAAPPVASPAATTAPATPSPTSPPAAATGDVVPRQWFILAAGYASAITLALLFLLFFGGNRQHALESLPDLVPPMDKSGQIGMKKVPPSMDVAPGHELRLGESQRFGNVRVTPLQVTRGPLKFARAIDEDPSFGQFGKKPAQREPSAPVLKLQLRFENVSRDQTFAPLDPTLVFKRIFDSRSGRIVALNFLGPEAERKQDGDLHYVYDQSEFSEYVLAGQDLNTTLQPGDAWETYIPSEEGISQVNGEWVWRVLFRKGYHPESRRGVTTLIDVRFRGDEITDEA